MNSPTAAPPPRDRPVVRVRPTSLLPQSKTVPLVSMLQRCNWRLKNAACRIWPCDRSLCAKTTALVRLSSPSKKGAHHGRDSSASSPSARRAARRRLCARYDIAIAAGCGPGPAAGRGAGRHLSLQRARASARRYVAGQSRLGRFQHRGELEPGHGADRHRLLRHVEHHRAVVLGRHQLRRLDLQRRGVELHIHQRTKSELRRRRHHRQRRQCRHHQQQHWSHCILQLQHGRQRDHR